MRISDWSSDVCSSDLPVLVRQDWLEAYDFTTKRGSQVLGDYARGADPFANIGERTVAGQVTSVVRAPDRSFQVKWTENGYGRGTEAGTSPWTAVPSVGTTGSAERRVGKEWVRTCRSAGEPVHKK